MRILLLNSVSIYPVLSLSKLKDPAACMLTVIGFLVSVSVVWVFISFLYMRSFVIN